MFTFSAAIELPSGFQSLNYDFYLFSTEICFQRSIWEQRKETDPQTYVSLYDSWSSLKYSLPLGVSSSLPPPMSSLHFLLSLSILTLSARGLPRLQESMARRRIYGLRGGNTFCASLSPFHERLFHDDTNIESFLCSLPFQALMTIPQISTNK